MNPTALLKLMRPQQYLKNALLFAAPGAAGRLSDWSVLWTTAAAFGLFCVVSSIGYVANDLVDVERDRLHPRKKFRPLASGAATPMQARILMVALGAIAVIGALFLPMGFMLMLALYALLTLFYSNGLKQIPWLELLGVSAGFTVRAAAGGNATDTSLSGWFLVVVTCSALLLIVGKRLGELVVVGKEAGSRAVLKHYTRTSLSRLAIAAAVVAVGAYTIWAVSASGAGQQGDAANGSTALISATTIPFAVAIGRYLMLTLRGRGEQPERLVVRDPIVVVAGAAWMVLYALGLYL